MAKKTFYCKCGRTISKQSSASVTGYEYPEDDKACSVCRYREVVTRYRNNAVLNINICQAGENKPKYFTECSSYSFDGTNNLDILSLDLDFLEELTSYVRSIEGVESTHFNSMDLADCRKSFVITFSKNKKGLSAKKNIIEKYFPGNKGFENKPLEPVSCDAGNVEVLNESPSVSGGSSWKPRCPYFSSLGEKTITCSMHFFLFEQKEFASSSAAINHYEGFCLGCFGSCETYKEWYEEEISSSDKRILDFKKCAYCCNSSGARGLVKNIHGTHSFCQIHKDERLNFDIDSACQWFNKYYPSFELNNSLGVANMPDSLDSVKLPYGGCKDDCKNLVNEKCSIESVSGRVLSNMVDLYSGLNCEVARKLKYRVLRDNKGCVGVSSDCDCASYLCEKALKNEYCCYGCSAPCGMSCLLSKELVPFGKLKPEDRAFDDTLSYAVPALDSSLDGRLEFIRTKAEDVLNNYVEIGFALLDMKNHKLFSERGYDSLVDCVESELGMKKSTCYNLIKVAEKFGDPETRRLLPSFREYNYAQCLEMSTMTTEQLSQVSPDMSKRNMQDLKKEHKGSSSRLEKCDTGDRVDPSLDGPKGIEKVEPIIEVSDYKVVDDQHQEQASAASEGYINEVGILKNSLSVEVDLNSPPVGFLGADEGNELPADEAFSPLNVLHFEVFLEAVSGREKDMVCLVDDIKKKYKVRKVDDLPGIENDLRLCLKATGFLECLAEFKRMFSEVFDLSEG